MRALLIVILLSATFPANAAERLHTVAFGDSVSGIAKTYYGDFSHSDFLLRFNGRKGTDLKPGERLRIPYCIEHRVAPGDNGSTLAKRHLGRASAWEAIATLNRLAPGAPLRPGQTIEIPVLLRHTLVRGDSLSGIAERYYDDPGKGSLLQAFNGIADPRDLAVGQTVQVPLIGLKLSLRTDPKPKARAVARSQPTEPKPAEEARTETKAVVRSEPPAAKPIEPPPVAPVLPAWFAVDAASAERAYRWGDFEAAQTLVESLIERLDAIPVARERARVWRLAAFIDVAFDRDDRACASFESMSANGASVEGLGDVSPRIRDVQAACSQRRASNAMP